MTDKQNEEHNGLLIEASQHDHPAISSSTTIVPDIESKDAESSKTPIQQYLHVPHPRPRRSSLESAFSELSEFSFYSNDLTSPQPFVRTASTQRTRLQQWLDDLWYQNYGALLVLAAQGFGTGMNVCTRVLETPGSHGSPMHPFQILFARQGITSLLCTAWALYTRTIPDFPLGPAHPRSVRWLLVTRGLTGFFGVFGMYFSLLYLPLSEATVLTFLAPILTCYVLSFVMADEPFTRQQQLAGLVSLVGVIFIAQPASLFSPPPPTSPPNASPPSTATPPPSQDPYPNPTVTPTQHLHAIGIAMIGVLGAVGAYTSIRAIGTRAHPFVSINYFSVWCTIVSLLSLVFVPGVSFRLPANTLEWGLLTGLGVCGFVMQWLLTAGFAYGGPSTLRSRGGLEGGSGSGAGRKKVSGEQREIKVSGTRAMSMTYTQMLFALAGDRFVFGITPSMMSWVGSVLILAGAVWVAAAKEGNAGEKGSRNGRVIAVEADGGVVESVSDKRTGQIGEEEVGLMSEEAVEMDELEHNGLDVRD